jgi:CRISPR-associated protein Csx10
MKTLTLNLYTVQPILATSFQGDPNSDVSYSYIPGSVIRGALLGKYLRDNSLPSDDIVADTEANKEVRRLFFTGKTRYLNAYLMTNNDQQPRSLPVPRSIFKQKGHDPNHNGIDVYDLSRIETSDIPSSLSSPKLLSNDNFCTVSYGEITLHKDKRRINIHHKRDRRKGRATKESGEIFRYEAIDASQSFQAAVICENDNDAIFLKDLLLKNPNLYLGGSQSAGYGAIEIKDIQIYDYWSEVGVSSDQRNTSEALTITLLSDVILRDINGQYVADYKLVQEELERLLGQKLSNVKAFVTSCLVGGFNRRWGLPLPQVQVLAAGSVLVFDDAALSPTQISDLENQGIGERKIDGFGRIVINWLGESKIFTAKLPSQKESSDSLLNFEDNSYEYSQAKFMAERILRQKLDSLLVEKVSSIVLSGKIYNSQLSRLRIVARQALLDKEKYRNSLLDLLSNLPKNSLSKLRGVKIDGVSIDEQIKKWLESCYEEATNPDSDKFWEKNQSLWLGNEQERRKLEVKIGNVKAGLTIDLVREYTLKLIIAVCKKATKESKENE